MRLSETQIVRAVTDLLKEKKGSEERLLQNVMGFLKKKRLLRNHRKIVAALEREIDGSEGRVRVTVLSARTLESSEQMLVKEKVVELFPGKKTELRYREKPNLIGGISLETDDVRYDATLSRALRLLSQSL